MMGVAGSRSGPPRRTAMTADASLALADHARPWSGRTSTSRAHGDRHAAHVRLGRQGDRQRRCWRRSPPSARSPCCCWSTSAGRCVIGCRPRSALAVVGAVFVCLGTLASRAAWLAAVAMAVVGFRRALRRRGQLGPRRRDDVAAAGVHPAGVAAGPASSIPDRLGGLGRWPRWPRSSRSRCCGRPRRETRCGARPRRPAGHWRPGCAPTSRSFWADGSEADSRATTARSQRASDAVAALQKAFLATPYRPTGLSTAARRWCGWSTS